jgi:LacI family transcriptional regulator
MATIRDVAMHSNVSIATVSRVVNNTGFVQQETRDRVMAAITKLGYQPNSIARSLKMERSNLVGILLPHMANQFYMDLATAIENTLDPEGYSLLLASSGWDIKKEIHQMNVFVRQRVEAIALVTVSHLISNYQEIFGSLTIPLIFADRSKPGLKTDVVLADNYDGISQLVTHLHSLGHTRIGFITGPSEIDTVHERLHGYRETLKEKGLTYEPDLVMKGINLSVATGYNLTLELLNSQKPTALVCGNNTLATGAMLACKELGISIPGDISLVAFGDFDLAPLLDPPLTVSTNSGYEMGLEVGKLIIERIKHPNQGIEPRCIRIPSKLVIRASTTSPKG